MAIIPALNDIEVTICVNDEPLKEFNDVETTSSPTAKHFITKYVQTDSEDQFSFRASISGTFESDCPTLEFQFYVDGVEVESELVLFKDQKLILGFWSADIRGVEVRNGEVKTFRFAEIKTTSDEASTESIEANKKLLLNVGTVAVEVHRKSEARPSQKGEDSLWYSEAAAFAAPTDVHEKSVKGEAKSHSTKFGDVAKSTAVWEAWRCNYLDGRGAPLARYEFKYRSEEALKQLRIVERTPEPEPEPEVAASTVVDEAVDLTQLDEEERLRAEEFVRNLRGERNALSSGTKTIKREREDGSPLIRNIRARNNKEQDIIDLVSDPESEGTV